MNNSMNMANRLMLPFDDKLEVAYLSRLFDNMSESYKLFWFQAIVNCVVKDEEILTYDDLINEMIADAWYMVTEYRLNLGPADNLESLVHYIQKNSNIRSNEKKENIIAYLEDSTDAQLKKRKRTLTLNVPYRLQSPFMEYVKGAEWKDGERKLAEKINMEKRLIYYFVQISGLQSQIKITSEWCSYIKKNSEIIRGWILYNMITYLQRRNPDVPGIINKLESPQERNLIKVKKYWRMISEVVSFKDIYSISPMNPSNISIDHFVPWSYVAHDELWNLSPTTKSANSSKSNCLPNWDVYFPRLCDLQYLAYESMWKHNKIREEFMACQREHVNGSEIRIQLYSQGLAKDAYSRNLEHILLPVYQSAHNMGFKEWIYQ